MGVGRTRGGDSGVGVVGGRVVEWEERVGGGTGCSDNGGDGRLSAVGSMHGAGGGSGGVAEIVGCDNVSDVDGSEEGVLVKVGREEVNP